MDTVYIKNTPFQHTRNIICCDAARFLPDYVYVHTLSDGRICAVKAALGKDPHPFPALCEAAVYTEGYWIVGIDTQKNCCFTPIFA